MADDKTYIKIDNLFAEFEKHYKVIENIHPHLDNDEDYHITDELHCLTEDGTELVICFWYESELHFIDIGAKKVAFNNDINAYRKFLENYGLPLHNIEDCAGKLSFCGFLEHRDEFRAQYCDWVRN